jgi:hypothetical protein
MKVFLSIRMIGLIQEHSVSSKDKRSFRLSSDFFVFVFVCKHILVQGFVGNLFSLFIIAIFLELAVMMQLPLDVNGGWSKNRMSSVDMRS